MILDELIEVLVEHRKKHGGHAKVILEGKQLFYDEDGELDYVEPIYLTPTGEFIRSKELTTLTILTHEKSN